MEDSKYSYEQTQGDYVIYSSLLIRTAGELILSPELLNSELLAPSVIFKVNFGLMPEA